MFTDINLSMQKLNETKKVVMTSIFERHAEAKETIAKSLKAIYEPIDDITTDNTDDLDALLNDELDGIGRDLDALLNDLLND